MKNKKHFDSVTTKNIKRWLRLQTLCILIFSIISFMIVKLGENEFHFEESVFLNSLGLIIPMCLFISVMNIIISRWFTKQANDLADGLAKAADGDYNAKLDTSKIYIFQSAFENFNKLEEELKNASKLQDEFVNNYSHEFKTPLTSIHGYAELLLEDGLTKKEQQKYLKIILEESEKLTNLANSSILLTKLDNQQIIPKKKEYDLSEQLRRCIICFEPMTSKKNINISCDIENTKYFGNEEIMLHLWNNLISNAVKFTPKNGSIKVLLQSKGNNITMSIQDSGIGMNKEELENIFNKFYQVDKSKTTEGLGLGLTIVSRIIELVNGKITVESEQSKGTKFTIELKKS